jgi:HlyD family secretion protein
MRYLGEQAEIEIVKKAIPRGRFVPLKFIEKYDGRVGVIWTLENGRLVKRSVQFGERLLDGRLQLITELPDNVQVVIDERGDLREGRAARPAEKSGS